MITADNIKNQTEYYEGAVNRVHEELDRAKQRAYDILAWKEWALDKLLDPRVPDTTTLSDLSLVECLADVDFMVSINCGGCSEGEARTLRRYLMSFVGTMRREFSENTGQFSWVGTRDGLRIRLDSANALSPSCTIVPKKVEVTRYVSVCDDKEQEEMEDEQPTTN